MRRHKKTISTIILNKRGSSAVLLSMVFVVFATSMTGAVVLCRKLAVKSECETFGMVWEKAILSEYDVYLLEEYNLMAYFGDEQEVQEKLNYYLEYSTQDKLDISIKGITVNLSGYQMSDPDNFKESLCNSFGSVLLESLLDDSERIKREYESDDESNRYVGNQLVSDTLPSRGIEDSIDIDSLSEMLSEEDAEETLIQQGTAIAAEMAMIRMYFGSHLYAADDNETFFVNEWEYIIKGSLNDEENFTACKNRIFLLRNALNLIYLATDSEKMSLITAAAEVITPGAMSVVTQLIIMEAWAAAEAKWDLDQLLDDNRIPLMKTAATWHTSISGIFSSDDLIENLSDEELENLNENFDELEELGGVESTIEEIKEGQTYEDYLMFLILAMDENVRLLRMMDIIQLNMKLRHYSDFNFEEYMCGVAFSITANGSTYDFQEKYS